MHISITYTAMISSNTEKWPIIVGQLLFFKGFCRYFSTMLSLVSDVFACPTILYHFASKKFTGGYGKSVFNSYVFTIGIFVEIHSFSNAIIRQFSSLSCKCSAYTKISPFLIMIYNFLTSFI